MVNELTVLRTQDDSVHQLTLAYVDAAPRIVGIANETGSPFEAT
jgi:hypothetical protein